MNDSRIDIQHAREQLKRFLAGYDSRRDPGFRLKTVHTYHVADNAEQISMRMGLEDEDQKLAVLIALLHDIGRFEEMRITREFNNMKFDHAAYGVRMLFDEGLIRRFINDDRFDGIIRAAIINHSRYAIEEGLNGRQLLHAKLIRDCDKTDNFRVKIEEKTENLFPGRINSDEMMETSLISDAVMEALRKRRCVNIADRITPMDYYVTIASFGFDISFDETKQLIREKNLIGRLLGRYESRIEKTKAEIEEIRRLFELEGLIG